MKTIKTIKVKLRAVSLALIGTFALSSCEKDNGGEIAIDQNSKMNLHETIVTMRNGAPAPGMSSIGQLAISSGFNELVNALMYVDTELNAGLVNLFVNEKEQYTVFAPTDEAFMNLYNTLGVTSIEELPADLVRDVLLYHVTEGRRAANSVVPRNDSRAIETLLGSSFRVYPDASITAIGNSANITAANISASNGIIHVIDAVLLPIQ